ncbi:MAG: hypothetical protein KDA53_15550 [Hyphomonas sp.]|nr:hypothetical protein [Hyphomonas sp.]
MNEAFFSSLPRFDEETVRPDIRKMRMILGQDLEEALSVFDAPPESAAPEEVTEEDAILEAAPAPEPEPEPAGADLAEIETLVASLSDTICDIESKAEAQTTEMIRAMAGRLFPQLAERFLADEIARHLPSMVPPSVRAVEIHASPALCERLEEIVRANPALSNRCIFVPADSLGPTDACVSWKTGGLTFDFDGLLKACLARIGSSQATMDE